MTLLGIDVSHYQGSVDWFAVAQSDVKFAFAKATEGNRFVDPTFARNWAQIREAGLVRGAYHFGRPGRDAETQAVHFAATVGQLGFRDLPPVLDLEEDDGHTSSHVANWARAFITKAESLFEREVMIYTGHFWREKLDNPVDDFFRQRKLWLAAYVPVPTLPKTWNDWTFLQYTDGRSNGPVRIAGVRPCDQNRFKGSETELLALCNAGGVVAQPPAPANPGAPGAPPWPGSHFVWPRQPVKVGPDVKLWQERMQKRGFNITTDGAYGPQSKAVCIAFQRNMGLSPDGIVGPRTWELSFTA